MQREAHLFLVGLGLRLDGDLDDRLGEFHALEDDRLQRIAERVARGRVLEAASATMSPAKASLMSRANWHASENMRPMRSRLPLTVLSSVHALGRAARVDAAEGQRADERVVHDLEGEHRQRLVRRKRALDLGSGLDVDALDRRNVESATGRKSTTPSSSGCTPLFLKAEPQNTGKNLTVDRALADEARSVSCPARRSR
jgi:hypothetical protein